MEKFFNYDGKISVKLFRKWRKEFSDKIISILVKNGKTKPGHLLKALI